jgi:hypothetical protein
MRPALYTQWIMNMKLYFLLISFSKKTFLVWKCAYKLKEYKDYFASVNRIRTENIQSPGEYVRNQIFKKLSGHDVPFGEMLSKELKTALKEPGLKFGLPTTSSKHRRIMEFRKSHQRFFRKTYFSQKVKRILTSMLIFLSPHQPMYSG